MQSIRRLVLGSFFIPLAAALSMSFLPPLCYRTGQFTACSQTSDYVPFVTCPNPEGLPWTCPSGAPNNAMVTRCVQASTGEAGRTVCNDHDSAVVKCIYKKAKCGTSPGDCTLETKDTEIPVKVQYLAGLDCIGQ